MTLRLKNIHHRDFRIKFVDESHTYYIDGSEEGYTSTTRLVHSLFRPFNADEVIDKMRKSKNWSSSVYFGRSPEEIKTGWEQLRNSAAKSGTSMHENIENFYNGVVQGSTSSRTSSREFDMFLAFRHDHPNLAPYRTEWCIFDEDCKVAGSVDMVYKDENNPGSYVIADWKRSKAIKMSNKWQRGTSKHTAHLDDCNFIHYSLQLAIYKYILERKYDILISDTLIVVLHPTQTNYVVLKTKDLGVEVQSIMDDRMEKSV